MSWPTVNGFVCRRDEYACYSCILAPIGGHACQMSAEDQNADWT
jgi:hypothetical protein